MSTGNKEVNIDEVLNSRAKQLAKKTIDNTLVETSTILVFNVGTEQKYAIPYYPVQRVNKISNIRKIPDTKNLFMGVTYLNSEVWPVINTAELLSLIDKRSFKADYFILLSKNGTKVALATSTVIGLEPFDKQKILTKFDEDTTTKSNLIKGIYGKDIALIDIETTFELIKNYNP
jgi:chemotaxis signal transduction protein